MVNSLIFSFSIKLRLVKYWNFTSGIRPHSLLCHLAIIQLIPYHRQRKSVCLLHRDGLQSGERFCVFSIDVAGFTDWVLQSQSDRFIAQAIGLGWIDLTFNWTLQHSMMTNRALYHCATPPLAINIKIVFMMVNFWELCNPLYSKCYPTKINTILKCQHWIFKIKLRALFFHVKTLTGI